MNAAVLRLGMASQTPPFDPNAFAKWLMDGLKETLSYRIRQALNRDQLKEIIQSKIPSKNQVFHQVLRQAFEKNGFQFEDIRQGDANFHLIRKKYRDTASESTVRRLVVIPGFGDTPGSWIPSFAFARSELSKHFDELLILDFPGYLGFLSHTPMVPSMAVLLSVVKTVCDANPPTVLIGHSLGGWLVGRVAQDLLRPIDHLIVVSPSGLIPEGERQAFGDVIVNSQQLPLEEMIKRVMHQPRKYHHLVRDEFKSFYSKPEVKQFVESVVPDQFINPLKAFRARKVSVIWGENDHFVPSHWLRYWVEHYGAISDAYVMKETGHLPQIERPMVFAEVLMTAIFGKAAKEGRGWKKVHSRVREQDLNPLPPLSAQQKLIS